jgi:hypothetical protein
MLNSFKCYNFSSICPGVNPRLFYGKIEEVESGAAFVYSSKVQKRLDMSENQEVEAV